MEKDDEMKSGEDFFNLSNVVVKKEIKNCSSSFYSLCIIKNERVAASSDDRIIRIYNLEILDFEFSLEGHEERVFCITTLDDEKIASSSYDKTIKIWRIEKDTYECLATLVGHAWSVDKVIKITNDRLGSCSLDKTIKFWSSKPPYNCLHTITDHPKWVKSIIQLKKNDEMIVSAGAADTVRFWDKDTYQCKGIIEHISCHWINSLCEVEDKVIVGEDNGRISILNAKTFQLENHIVFEGDKLGFICSIIKVNDNVILCGDACGTLVQININKNISIFKECAHFNAINEIVLLNRSNFISCSWDRSIKIWNCIFEENFEILE